MRVPNKLVQKLLISLALVAAPSAWAASHALDNSQSTITFNSVKKEHILETHLFNQFEGEIAATGDVRVAIDLSSVNTGVDIRNDRLKTMLFEADLYPKAIISAKVDPSVLANVDEAQLLAVSGLLELHGMQKDVEMELRLVALETGVVMVNSVKPVIIKSKDFGLDKGVAMLSEVMGGISIGQSVPVSFSLHFTP